MTGGVRLRRVVTNVVCKSDGRSAPFLGLEHIEGGSGRLLVDELPAKEADDALRYEADDVLFGKLRPYLAKSLIASRDGTCTSELLVLRPGSVMAPKFLYYVSRSTPFLDLATTTSYGSKMPRTSWDAISDFVTWLPGLDQQQRIVRFLDAETARIDRAVSQDARLGALIAERWEASVSAAVTGQMSGLAAAQTGNPYLPLVAAEWPVRRLKDVAKRVDVGIAEAATHAYAAEGVPLLRSTNIRPNRLDTGDLLYIDPAFDVRNHRKRLKANDILTVRTGNAGVSAVVPEGLNGCQSFTQLVTTLLPEFSPDFFCFYLNSHAARRYFHATGWGSAQRNISVPILANAPVPCPPPVEQARLAAHLLEQQASLQALQAASKRRAELHRERRSALITAAVTGRLDVTTARGVA